MKVSDYPTVNFNGGCGEASGDTPNRADSTGMQVYQQATVNGNPVSNCVIANGDAKIFNITLTQTMGAYAYQVLVDGQGPSGLGGYIHLAFTDESGDTYYLKIYSSNREQHTVDFNSSAPNIKTIWWCDNDFDVPSSKTTKPDFRVTSPVRK